MIQDISGYPENCETHHAPRSAISDGMGFYKCGCQFSTRPGYAEGWTHMAADMKAWPVPTEPKIQVAKYGNSVPMPEQTPLEKTVEQVLNLADISPVFFEEGGTVVMKVKLSDGRIFRWSGVLETPHAEDMRKQ